MRDLIDRQAAIYAFQMFRKYESNRSNKDWVDRIEAFLKAQPTIDAEPVRRGRWVGVSPMVDSLECSICGWNILGEEFETNYCPNCGAKMEVDDDTLV